MLNRLRSLALILTGLVCLLGSDYASAMYDPGTGRFLQRDPSGYPDGMNGYGAYHVIRGGVDPSGNVTLSLDPASEAGMQYFTKQFPKGIYGQATFSFEITGECAPCKCTNPQGETEDKWQIQNVQITVYSYIILDPQNIQNGKDRNGAQTIVGDQNGQIGIYGHEQVHIREVLGKLNAAKEDIVAMIEPLEIGRREDQCVSLTKRACELKLATALQNANNNTDLVDKLNELISAGLGHHDPPDVNRPNVPREKEQWAANGNGNNAGAWQGHTGRRLHEPVR